MSLTFVGGRQVRRIGSRPDGSRLDSVLVHAWSMGGRLAVVESGGAVYVWNPKGEEDLTLLTAFDLLLAIDPLPLGASNCAVRDREEAFWAAAAWFADGSMIALMDEGGVEAHRRPYRRMLSWSQDGATLAASGVGASIRLISTDDGTEHDGAEHRFVPQFPPPELPETTEARDPRSDYERTPNAEESPVLSALGFVHPGVLAVGLKDGRLCLVGSKGSTTVLYEHVSPVERIAFVGLSSRGLLGIPSRTRVSTGRN